MRVEIVAQKGITDGSRVYAHGEIVDNPSPRLQELALTGEEVLGERVARVYRETSEKPAQEVDEIEYRLRRQAKEIGMMLVAEPQFRLCMEDLGTLVSVCSQTLTPEKVAELGLSDFIRDSILSKMEAQPGPVEVTETVPEPPPVTEAEPSFAAAEPVPEPPAPVSEKKGKK